MASFHFVHVLNNRLLPGDIARIPQPSSVFSAFEKPHEIQPTTSSAKVSVHIRHGLGCTYEGRDSLLLSLHLPSGPRFPLDSIQERVKTWQAYTTRSLGSAGTLATPRLACALDHQAICQLRSASPSGSIYFHSGQDRTVVVNSPRGLSLVRPQIPPFSICLSIRGHCGMVYRI